MIKGKTSWTAEHTACLRAIASLEPDDKIRNPDNLAERFISKAFWESLPGLKFDYNHSRATIDLYKISGYFYVNARTKYFDAILEESIENGIKQVVILGAGYDSRAYRFHQMKSDVSYYEIDIPETLNNKKQKVTGLFKTLPSWVKYIPFNFNTQSLGSALENSGYCKKLKSLFIWEGVTMYISETAFRATLDSVKENCAPESVIVFDYILKPVTNGDYRYYGARWSYELVASIGEPFTFGIECGGIEKTLNTSGFSLIEDLGDKELTEKYLIKSNNTPDGRPHGFFRIVKAIIPLQCKKNSLRQTIDINPENGYEEATPPEEIAKFLEDYAKDFSNHNVKRILTHYSDDYRYYGANKASLGAFFERIFKKCPFNKLKNAQIILTYCQTAENSAEIKGYMKSTIGLDPLGDSPEDILFLRKEAGKWKWAGNG